MVSGSLNKGGAERFVSTLLQHFDRTRVRPGLCLMRDDIGYPLPEDVPLHVLGYRGRRSFLPTVTRLRRVIEETRPDVVLSNLHGTNVATGLALRGSAHQPAWVGRIASNPERADGWLGSFLARRTYPRASRLVVNSRGLIAPMRRRYPFTEGRMEVLGNPTDFAAIDRLAGEPAAHLKPSDVPLLIAIGRLGPEKRYDLLLDAFRRVRRRQPATLWICGDGPLRETLCRWVRRWRLEDSVRLVGYCPNPYALLRQADVYVLCSDFEGLPNALIEAQGLGVPAVSTRCPHGPDEIVDDGRTGFLTPVGDAEALAEAMSMLLADSELHRRMAAAARILTRERFAAGSLVRAWEDLLLRQARRGDGQGR